MSPTPLVSNMRDRHGGSPERRVTSSSSGHGVRSMTTSKAQTSTGKRCWPGAFRPCWRPPARPRTNGTQERWWLPSASSTGCVGWGSTHQPGTDSTGVDIDVKTLVHNFVLSKNGFSLFLEMLESQRYKKLSRDEYNKLWLIYGIASLVLFVSAGVLAPLSLVLFTYGGLIHGLKGGEYEKKAKEAEKREQSTASKDPSVDPTYEAWSENVSRMKEGKGMGEGKSEPQESAVKSALESRLEAIDSLKERGVISDEEYSKMRNKALGLD